MERDLLRCPFKGIVLNWDTLRDGFGIWLAGHVMLWLEVKLPRSSDSSA